MDYSSGATGSWHDARVLRHYSRDSHLQNLPHVYHILGKYFKVYHIFHVVL